MCVLYGVSLVGYIEEMKYKVKLFSKTEFYQAYLLFFLFKHQKFV